jgi:hypothetical protein
MNADLPITDVVDDQCDTPNLDVNNKEQLADIFEGDFFFAWEITGDFG